MGTGRLVLFATAALTALFLIVQWKNEVCDLQPHPPPAKPDAIQNKKREQVESIIRDKMLKTKNDLIEWQTEVIGQRDQMLDEKIAQVEQQNQEIKKQAQEIAKQNQVFEKQKELIEKKIAEAQQLTKMTKVIEQKTEEVRQLSQQLSEVPAVTDTAIARRFTRVPHTQVAISVQSNLLEVLIPNALNRWTCGIEHNHTADEELLRVHPIMRNHLDGEQHFSRIQKFMYVFGWQRLRDKVFLEVGFGVGLTAALLRGLNTTVYATDTAPVPWTPLRHGPFFEVLARQVRSAAVNGMLSPHFDLEQATAYGKRCGFDVEGVHELCTDFEHLEGVPDDSVDASYSLGLLQHIRVGEAFKALARVHRHGSLTCHQADLRDLTAPSKPLDFLFMSDDEFEQLKNVNPYFGNRVRLSEFIGAAQSNGFELVHVTKQHETATEEGLQYAKESVAKLHQLNKSTHRYASWDEADLRCTSNEMPMTGLFFCFEYVGRPVSSKLELPCKQDKWTKTGFLFGGEM